MHPGEINVFPEDTVFHYVAEGAANIVYRYSIPFHGPHGTPEPSVLEEYGDGTPPPSEIDKYAVTKLDSPNEVGIVRFRKNLPTTAPCAVSHAHWERLIKPLFPECHLVEQALIQIKPGNIIAQINQELRGWEGYASPTKGSKVFLHDRPAKRQGIYLADDDHALLVTDMTSHEAETVVEFKPKWLLQSPSAPPNSKRCRHCARMAQKNAELGRNYQKLIPFFCPLDLSSKDRKELLHVAQSMLPPSTAQRRIRFLADWLEINTIVPGLKKWQHQFDKIGVLEGDVNDEKFLCAMTLRDCSVFVRTSTVVDVTDWECRIGDLDLKDKDKVDYWRRVERLLIEEGWYEGTEKDEDRQPITCHLFPGPFDLMPKSHPETW